MVVGAVACTTTTQSQPTNLGGSNGSSNGSSEETDPLALWSGCITSADFALTNFAAAWDGLETSEGFCKQCHVSPGSFQLPVGENNFFAAITTNRAVLGQFFRVDNSTTPAQIVVNVGTFQAVASGPSHPRFDLDNAGMTALDQLYQLALNHQQADQCGPPTLDN